MFLTLALLAGVYMVFVTGPFQAPDEANHFFRAYQISEGALFGARSGNDAGGTLPNAVINAPAVVEGVRFHADHQVYAPAVKMALRKLWKPMRKTRRSFASFPNTVITSPVCYSPQVAGIATARFFGAPVLGMMYGARLTNLLVWMAIVFAAIRFAPLFNRVILLVALMPMTIFLAASVSADTMINACAILLVALVSNARFDERAARTSSLLLIALVCVAISSTKLVYLPLVSLVLTIPSDRYGGARRMTVWCCGIIGVCSLLALLWWLEIRRVYVPLNYSNMAKQLSLLAAHPLNYLVILAKTIGVLGGGQLTTFVGVLGWLDTTLPAWIYVTYVPALIGTALLDRGPNGASYRLCHRALVAFVCGVSFILIATAQYLTWNKPGAELVEGIFGRLLIPLAVPALLVFQNRRFPNVSRRVLTVAVFLYSLLVLSHTCYTIFTRYWG